MRFLVPLVLAFPPTAAYVAWVARRRWKLSAGTPDAAGIDPGEPTVAAEARKRTWSRLLRAMRLLDEVRRHDETLAFLPAPLRKEIDGALDEFYEG